MKDNKVEIFVKIMLFFCVFIVYSAAMVVIVNSSLESMEQMFSDYISTRIEERFNEHINLLESTLKSFSLNSYLDKGETIDDLLDKKEEVIRGLSIYNKLFGIEGNSYVALANGEIFSSSDSEFYLVNSSEIETEQVNLNESTYRLKRLLSNYNISVEQKLRYICDDEGTFYFIYPVYHGTNFADAFIIKECNLQINKIMFEELLDIYGLNSVRAVDKNEKTIYYTYRDNKNALLKMLDEKGMNVQVDIDELEVKIIAEFDSSKFYGIYTMCVILMLIVNCGLLFGCSMSFLDKNCRRSYKISLTMIVLCAVTLAEVYRYTFEYSFIEVYERFAEAIKAEDEKAYVDYKNKIDKVSEYIKERMDESNDRKISPSSKESQKIIDDLLLTEKKTKKNLVPLATGFFYSPNGKLFYNDGTVMESTDQEMINKLKRFEESTQKFYRTSYSDETSNGGYISLSKSVDKDGKTLMIYGMDFDFSNYHAIENLHDHLNNVNSDICEYKFLENGEVLKRNVISKDGNFNFSNSNKYISEFDEEDRKNLIEIKNSGKDIGMYKIGSFSNREYRFYIKELYSESYTVIIADTASINKLKVEIIKFDTFIMFMFIMFMLTLCQKDMALSKKYKIKEYEIHSNY